MRNSARDLKSMLEKAGFKKLTSGEIDLFDLQWKLANKPRETMQQLQAAFGSRKFKRFVDFVTTDNRVASEIERLKTNKRIKDAWAARRPEFMKENPREPASGSLHSGIERGKTNKVLTDYYVANPPPETPKENAQSKDEPPTEDSGRALKEAWIIAETLDALLQALAAHPKW